MAQRSRRDEPGRRHHVMNRGVAKRVIFPDHAAKIRFIALIACSVRRGEMRVEALAVMDTHFHLLAYVCAVRNGILGHPDHLKAWRPVALDALLHICARARIS